MEIAEEKERPMTYRVAVIVGSLRKDSYNRKIAEAAMALAPASLIFDRVEIGGLSLYNQDFDTASPESWSAFRDQIRRADALLFATPEYNRSVPGVLKNAIDIGSRPFGHSVWSGKPAAILSATPGNIGAFGANHHLRQSLVTLNVPVMPTPEVYISGVHKLLDETGAVKDEALTKLLTQFMRSFSEWVGKFAG